MTFQIFDTAHAAEYMGLSEGQFKTWAKRRGVKKRDGVWYKDEMDEALWAAGEASA